MDDSLAQLLVCPRDHQALSWGPDGWLTCAGGHRYPIVEGVPVLLSGDNDSTLGIQDAVLRRVREQMPGDPRAPELYLESLGLNDDQLGDIARMWHAKTSHIDPAVQFLVGATCGIAYKETIGQLTEYPIPDIPLPESEGGLLVDVGCNWGRWCVSAARKGYRVIGVDPQLGAVMAARRVAHQLGLNIGFVCADARFLPFDTAKIDAVFSYSVLQHFSRADCLLAIQEIRRVLRTGGLAKIQMASAFGVRSAYHLARRRFRETRNFEVRYYTPGNLLNLFESNIGRTRLSVDCYFGLGLQSTDATFMNATARMAVRASEVLKKTSAMFPPLKWAADSLYMESVRS